MIDEPISVFEWGHVVVSNDFLDQIPSSIDKTEFFRDINSSEICESQHIDNRFSFQGSWINILSIQKVLEESLKEWNSNKLIDTNSNTKDQSHLQENKSNEKSHPNLISEQTEEENSLDFCSLATQIFAPKHSQGKIEPQCNVLLPNAPQQASKKNSGLSAIAISRRLETLQKQRKEDENVVSPKKEQVSANGTTFPSKTETPRRQRKQAIHVVLDSNEQGHDRCTNSVDTLNSGSGEDKSLEECDDKSNDAVENEIYMDIKLTKKPTENIFEDPTAPVTLVVASEDMPGVEVLQLKLDGGTQETLIGNENDSMFDDEQRDAAMLRRKRYEAAAPYKFFCSQCSFKTKRESHFNRHATLHERVCKIYTCTYCNFSALRATHLKRHTAIHNKPNLKCNICPYVTDKDALLARHERIKHKFKKSEPPSIDILQCSECSYMTRSEKFMQRHIVVHTNSKKGKSFKCQKCSYQGPSRSNYYRHLSTVHGDERNHLCKICGLRFKRSDTLVQHSLTHADTDPEVRAFQCSKCKKYYRTQTQLDDHMLTHSEKRTYLCEICGLSFKTRAVQMKHTQLMHLAPKVLPCPKCPKKFNSKYLQKQHIKTHSVQEERIQRRLIPRSNKEEGTKLTLVDSDQWCNSLMAVPASTEDVQVLVVQQEPQPELILNQDAIVVQDGPLLQMTSAGQSHTLTLPVLPVEYVLPQQVTTQVGNSVGHQLPQIGTQIGQETPQDGEFITLTFV